jgi:hypothetical protein
MVADAASAAGCDAGTPRGPDASDAIGTLGRAVPRRLGASGGTGADPQPGVVAGSAVVGRGAGDNEADRPAVHVDAGLAS